MTNYPKDTNELWSNLLQLQTGGVGDIGELVDALLGATHLINKLEARIYQLEKALNQEAK